jgi:hypothetical protein
MGLLMVADARRTARSSRWAADPDGDLAAGDLDWVDVG